LFDEARPQAIEETKHVVGHQHLAVAGGADADGGNLESFRNLGGRVGRDSLDHDGEGTRFLHRAGVLHQLGFVAEFPEDPTLTRDLAYLLASCPDRKLRQPQRAVEFAKKVADKNP
jgi:hypothetical protein